MNWTANYMTPPYNDPQASVDLELYCVVHKLLFANNVRNSG
jgi:hypothetical protein